MATARILTRNLERKKPTTPTGAKAIDHLKSLDADVMVLTESRVSFPAGDGHAIWSRTHGEPDERKVVMWSKQPWTVVDDLGDPDLPPSRFVAATTQTPVGPIHVMGVCISWHMANVQYGARNRKPWEDHVTYCRVLERMISDRRSSTPLVIAGDFNQRVTSPPKTTGGAHREAMASLLRGLTAPTIGVVPGWEQEENDHIALRDLTPGQVRGWSNVVDGVRCTDHAGVMVDVSR